MLAHEAFEGAENRALGYDLLLGALVHDWVGVATASSVFASLDLEEVLWEMVDSIRGCSGHFKVR
jgi:hypothetical protein